MKSKLATGEIRDSSESRAKPLPSIRSRVDNVGNQTSGPDAAHQSIITAW
jgi:hypothetical protein